MKSWLLAQAETTDAEGEASTTEAVITASNDDGTGGGSDGGAPDGTGIRQAATGIQASFDRGLFGDVALVTAINGVDHQVDFRIASEIIGASWVWLVILALVLAYSIVSGLERRRSDKDGESSS